MKITVVGRGNIGGGLADRWERAGHEVTRLGSDGGDVSDAEDLYGKSKYIGEVHDAAQSSVRRRAVRPIPAIIQRGSIGAFRPVPQPSPASGQQARQRQHRDGQGILFLAWRCNIPDKKLRQFLRAELAQAALGLPVISGRAGTPAHAAG